MWEKWNQMKLIEEYQELMEDSSQSDTGNYGRIGQFLFQVRDYVHAVDFLEKAMELRDVSACFYLGICYKYSLGVKGKEQEAENLFAQWIAKTEPDKIEVEYIWKAYCLFYGYGLEQDEDKAIKILTRSAQSRNIEACLLLGFLYSGEVDIPYANLQLAREYLEAAAEENSVEAAYALSYIYQYITNGSYIEEAQAAYGYVTGQLMRVKEKYPSYDSYTQLIKHYERGCIGMDASHYAKLAEECRQQRDILKSKK